MTADDDKHTGLRSKLHELESKEESGHDLITLYIPHDKPISDVIDYLKEEYLRSGTTLGNRDRRQAECALSSILSQLKDYDPTPENGIALFCVANLEKTGTNCTCTIIEPPESLTIYLYRRSKKFELEPLWQMLDEKNIYGLLVLDLSVAWWGFLRGDRIKPAGNSTANIHAKHRKGGQSSARFQRLREIAVDEFYSRVGTRSSDTFLAEKDFFSRFRGVLIGGPGRTKEDFFSGHFLHHEIHKRVIGLFDVAKTDEGGLAELADAARDAISRENLTEEKDLLDWLRHELAKDDGLAVYGEERVRKNLSSNAVWTLLLSAGLRKSRRRITCLECGHAGERTISLEPGMTVQDVLAHTCRICTDPVIGDEEVDIVEELNHLADQSGAKTKIISENFEEGKQFLAEYGGIAAILRYKTGM